MSTVKTPVVACVVVCPRITTVNVPVGVAGRDVEGGAPKLPLVPHATRNIKEAQTKRTARPLNIFRRFMLPTPSKTIPENGISDAYSSNPYPGLRGSRSAVWPVVLTVSTKLSAFEPRVNAGGTKTQVTPLGNPLQERFVGCVGSPVFAAIVIAG